jgi:hypothetical protein
MEENLEALNDGSNKKNQNNNPFVNFIEDYYGYFKLFISSENMYEIGKINKKLMSLNLIDTGNILLHKKENKIKKMKKIIIVRSIYILYI